MKLFGKKIDKPSAEICVIPRADKDYVFKAEAVLDFDDFDKLCPEPKESTSLNAKTKEVTKVKGKAYEERVEAWSTNRMNYMIIKSLSATEGLEWDNIDLKDVKTWVNYKDELMESGLSAGEVNRVVSIVLEANSLDDKKYKEAHDRFLASQSKKA